MNFSRYFLGLALLFSISSSHAFHYQGVEYGNEEESLCRNQDFVPWSERQQMSAAEIMENNSREKDFTSLITPINSKDEYCRATPKDFINKLCLLSGRLGLDNEGGLLGIKAMGICWWQSQFHRKMNYLTYFLPQDKREIDDSEFADMMKKIWNFQVVPIPGYNQFKDFLLDPKYPKRKIMLTKFLQNKAGETTLKFGWIKGLEGKANRGMNPANYSERDRERQRQSQVSELEKIYETLRKPGAEKVVYVMLQEPMMLAHAGLIYDVRRHTLPSKQVNYHIRITDPNKQKSKNYEAVIDEYFFDTKEAQWFNRLAYARLIKIRDIDKSAYVIASDGTGAVNSVRRSELLIQKNTVQSEDWNLYLQQQPDLEQIDEAYHEYCGKSAQRDTASTTNKKANNPK